MLTNLCGVYSLLIILVVEVNSARILGIVPTSSFSHQIAFRPLWRELALRGHDLTLLTTDPINDPTLKNVREISWHNTYQYWNVTGVTEKHKYNVLKIMSEMIQVVNKVISVELEHPEVLELLQNQSEHFDLVMVEFLFPTMWAFSWRFKCPFIGLMSLDATISGHEVLGNPIHPALYTDFQLPFVPPLSFFERLFNTLFYLLFKVYAWYLISFSDARAKDYFGADLPPLRDIAKNVSMLFINTNPAFHTIRPLSPATVQFGGFNHIHSPKPLPQELQVYLDNHPEGVVYFSLGTNVKSTSIKPELKQVIVESLAMLPYAVLWKFDADLPDMSQNVEIIQWAPQQDILRHPNIKLFVSQGGLQSIEEAIYYHVPMVAIPFYGDQLGNSKIIERKGLGLAIDRSSVDVEILFNSMMEVIQNPKYKANVQTMADLMADQPMTGVEKAIWWTEYVIRHKGAPHLINKARDVPFYQYLLLDVIACLLILLFIALLLIYSSVKLICKIFDRNINEKKKVD